LNPTKIHYSITQVNGYIYRKFPYHSTISLNIFYLLNLLDSQINQFLGALQRVIKDDTEMCISLHTQQGIEYQGSFPCNIGHNVLSYLSRFM
jgi:hypothetical protein